MKRLPLPFLLVLLFGCAPGGQPMGTVKGKITLDGYPLAKGVIKFDPGLEHGSPSSINIQDGEYLGKAFPGLSRVFVSSLKSTGQVKLYDTPDSPTRDVLEETIPAQYNKASGLSFEVKLGTNEYDVALLTHLPQAKAKLPRITPSTPIKEPEPKEPEPKEVASKDPASKEIPGGALVPAANTPPQSSSSQVYAPPPAFTPTDHPAVRLLIWTCQLLAIMVLIFVVVGALALMVREKSAAKPADALVPAADLPSASTPASDNNAPSLWGKIALLVGGAVCIVALLMTAEVVRLLVRMEERGERLEHKIEYLLRK